MGTNSGDQQGIDDLVLSSLPHRAFLLRDPVPQPSPLLPSVPPCSSSWWTQRALGTLAPPSRSPSALLPLASLLQVLMVDTEGFESTGKSNSYDDRIFAVSAILSRCLRLEGVLSWGEYGLG